jgi:hypothetical protein
MNILMENWRSVPPNWALRWGITPQIAMLTATSRDGACAPGGTPVAKGSVVVMAEAIDTGNDAKSDRAFTRLRGLLRVINSTILELDIAPAQIAINGVGPYGDNEKQQAPDWIKLTKLYRRDGFVLTRINETAAPMRSLHILNNPGAYVAAPRLFVAPRCERLLKTIRDELRETQPLTDPMRALCYSVAIAPPAPTLP